MKCWGSQRPLGCAARLCSPAGAPHESLSARRTCRPGRCVRTQGLCPAFRDCWCLGGLLCTAGPGETLRRQTRDPALAVHILLGRVHTHSWKSRLVLGVGEAGEGRAGGRESEALGPVGPVAWWAGSRASAERVQAVGWTCTLVACMGSVSAY